MFLFSCLFLATSLTAATPDTLASAVVTADKGVVVSRTDAFHFKNVLSVPDALQRFSGLYVSDLGGYSGLKTVSLRGMGSAHTSIYVDGVRVGNVQSGQTDLGLLGLENFDLVKVDYAQNSVLFSTARPVFAPGSNVAGRFSVKGGSFNTLLPYGRVDWRLNNRISMSVNLAGTFSQGNFPYADSLKRNGNDISLVRAGVDFFGLMDGGQWHLKAFANGSDRGTPGSASWPSTDRQKDKNAYVQGTMNKHFSPLYELLLSGKVSYDDLAYKSSYGNSDYDQREGQLNSSHIFTLADWWKVSVAADVQYDKLKSDNYDAKRFGYVASLGTAVALDKFSADAALEYDGAKDIDHKNWSCVSPSLSLRYELLKGLDFVAFGRRAYRIPMFNELYYAGYGNPDLKAEDAWLTDAGLQWNEALDENWTLGAKADGFYNFLKNKIVSAPSTTNPAVWLPYNVGKVRSLGADLSADLAYRSGDWKTSFIANYSYQKATDRSDSKSATYGQQIPYIAKHTMSLVADGMWRTWEAEAVWNYRGGRRDSAGDMPDWNTLDLNLTKTFGGLSLSVYLRNITDQHYELSTGYPLPGFSALAGISYRF